jgi:transcriptional regulator with XRE-family HTH domain
MERKAMSAHRHYKRRNFDFAQLLFTLRKRTKLTQKEVASRIEVTEKSIRNWEGGSCYPTIPHLRKIIELYLEKQVFTPGHEQEEACMLWNQFRENAPLRTGNFDELWFATILHQWRIHQVRCLLRKNESEASDRPALHQQAYELFHDGLSAAPEGHSLHLTQEIDQALSLLIKQLKKQRYLLILDNLERLFQKEVLARS